jgi:phosphatidylglycerol:prolipoprotein diacylglycerol transferase
VFPELLRLGPVTITTYGLMLALAFVAAGLYLRWALKRQAIDPNAVYNILFAAIVGGVIGARLFYVVANWGEFATQPMMVFFLPAGGLVFQGGAVGGALAVWAVVIYERLPRPAVMDAAAPALSIGAAVGRVGCFCNGCCAGQPSTAWYALPFFGYAEPRVPIQIADMGYNLAIAGALAWLFVRGMGGGKAADSAGRARPPLRKGSLFWLWFVLYGVCRFVIEFWRAAPPGPVGTIPLGLNPRVFLGLTSPQLIAAGMVVFGVATLAWWRSRREGEPDAPEGEPA